MMKLNQNRLYLGTLFVALALTFTSLGGYIEHTFGDHPRVVEYVTPCQEDQPCWDCSTHGNKVCGP
jgi:hypothetical protein